MGIAFTGKIRQTSPTKGSGRLKICKFFVCLGDDRHLSKVPPFLASLKLVLNLNSFDSGRARKFRSHLCYIFLIWLIVRLSVELPSFSADDYFNLYFYKPCLSLFLLRLAFAVLFTSRCPWNQNNTWLNCRDTITSLPQGTRKKTFFFSTSLVEDET